MKKNSNKAKHTALYLCAAMMVGLLSGCGAGSAGDVAREVSNVASGSAVSGSAVSGNAVSGAAVSDSEKPDGMAPDSGSTDFDKKYPDFVGDVETVLRTENYGYQCSHDKKGEILQVRLADSHTTTVNWDRSKDIKYIYDVLAVRGGYLYCMTEDDKENGCVYRIPIEENEKGEETLLTERAEELINGKKDDCFVDIETVYIGDRYLICPKEGSSGKLLRLDLKKGNKTTLSGPKKWSYDAMDQLLNCGDYFVVKIDDEEVYAAHVEKGKWTKISDGIMSEEEIQIGAEAWNPEGYYYAGTSEELELTSSVTPGVEVHRYDFQSQKNSLWISEQQLREAVKEVKRSEYDPDALDVCAVTRLYTQSDRVYVEVQSNWKKGEEYHVTNQVFSRGVSEKELRYEKALTECMKENSSIRRGSFVAEEYSAAAQVGIRQDHVVMESVKLYAMIDGKAYMVCYDGETGEEKRAEYTLATGEFHWITDENMDALKWHSFRYEPDDLFYDVDVEPTDTVARWGSMYDEYGMRGIMDVGDMGFEFKED